MSIETINIADYFFKIVTVKKIIISFLSRSILFKNKSSLTQLNTDIKKAITSYKKVLTEYDQKVLTNTDKIFLNTKSIRLSIKNKDDYKVTIITKDNNTLITDIRKEDLN